MGVVQPGEHQFIDLIRHARSSGFSAFPNADEPEDFPFWGTYQTSGECPLVLVGITGEVIVQYPERSTVRSLMQQWNYQGQGKESQKYLDVWFSANPSYPKESSAHSIHRLVGLVHVPYTQDCFYRDGNGLLQCRPGLQIDHQDGDKSNNSFFNLHWVTADQNQRMRSWTKERKQMYFNEQIPFDIDVVSRDQSV